MKKASYCLSAIGMLVLFVLAGCGGGLKGDSTGGPPATKSWRGTKQIGAGGTQPSAARVAVDSGGNVYVMGTTDGGLDGSMQMGTEDTFLIKYTSAGDRVFTRQTGTAGKFTWAMGLAVDASNNVYVTGWAYGGLDGNTQTGAVDVFLAKYTSSGNKVFTKQTGTAGSNAQSQGLVVDTSNNVYVAGSTTGGLDGNTQRGVYDMFLSKYTSAGSRVYTQQTGSAGANVRAFDNAIDASNNVYVTGWTNVGLNGNTLTGTLDVFIAKYTAAGGWVYTKQMGAAARNTYARAVVADSGGNVYVTGYTDGGLNGNTLTGTTDLFVTKYTSTGGWVYTKQMGATGKDTVAKGVAVDSGGNVYVTGSTTGGLDGNALIGTRDVFLTKYDPSGNKQ